MMITPSVRFPHSLSRFRPKLSFDHFVESIKEQININSMRVTKQHSDYELQYYIDSFLCDLVSRGMVTEFQERPYKVEIEHSTVSITWTDSQWLNLNFGSSEGLMLELKNKEERLEAELKNAKETIERLTKDPLKSLKTKVLTFELGT